MGSNCWLGTSQHRSLTRTVGSRWGGEADEKEVRYERKKLTKIAEKFENGEYTLDEYVDNVSKWMGIRR